jgi:uncharacterized cupin superfamily protein
MPKVFHIKELNFEMRESSIPEFRWHTTRFLAKIVDSRHLQFDIRSLDPGKFSFPYHSHRASEELFYIISGESTLRTPDGFQKVITGDIVFFEEGPSSAHQLYNHTDSPCVYLDIRSFFGIDVTDYPDSGKINVSPFMEIFENTSKTNYYKGEENVSGKWPEDILRKNEGD